MKKNTKLRQQLRHRPKSGRKLGQDGSEPEQILGLRQPSHQAPRPEQAQEPAVRIQRAHGRRAAAAEAADGAARPRQNCGAGAQTDAADWPRPQEPNGPAAQLQLKSEHALAHRRVEEGGPQQRPNQ